MRTSKTRGRKFTSTIGKIVMALIFASMIGGTSGVWAQPRYDDRHPRPDEQRRYERRDRERYEHRRRIYRRYVPPPAVYAPPPVVYAPPAPPPGISIFFPPIIIR